MQRRSWLTLLVPIVLSSRLSIAQSTTARSESVETIPHLSDAQVIAAAVLALPPSFRDGAGVIEFSKNAGSYMTLRPTRNGFLCVGPRGGESVFNAECFNPDVFPLFARAFALRAQGVKSDDIDRQITEEVRGGKLKLPARPVASYLMRGPASAYDPSTGQVAKSMKTWQTIDCPNETGAALGLPETELPGSTMPYAMQAGTVWAHIMVMQP